MRLTHLTQMLKTLSPLHTLDRGYAIVQHNHQVITHSNQVTIGDELSISLANGVLTSIVKKTVNNEDLNA